METLTKVALAKYLHDIVGINKREAKDVIELFFEKIRLALESGIEVKIAGFGHFRLRDKKERPGCNPKTKKKIPVSARRSISFKPSQNLKNLVAKSEPVTKEKE